MPGFSSLKFKIERICQVLARITEREANYEQQIMQLLENYLFSHNEMFLQANFLNYQNQKVDEVTNRQSSVMRSSKGGKAKSSSARNTNYLFDRIQKNKLNQILLFVVLALLFLLSSIFFISVNNNINIKHIFFTEKKLDLNFFFWTERCLYMLATSRAYSIPWSRTSRISWKGLRTMPIYSQCTDSSWSRV